MKKINGIPLVRNCSENVLESSKKTQENGSKREKKKLNIDYENAIKSMINSDDGFSKFIRQSELGLREFVQKGNLNLSCNFKLEKDLEIPNWEKIMLTIEFVDEKFDSDEKIKIWDQLDDIIREKINDLINIREDSEKGSIRNFNRKFFIELNSL